jgi:hypothetical protein
MNTNSTIVPYPENEPHARSERFFRNLERYIADEQKSDILYEYQKNIVHDTARFLGAGGQRGYIEAPTGTVKPYYSSRSLKHSAIKMRCHQKSLLSHRQKTLSGKRKAAPVATKDLLASHRI